MKTRRRGMKLLSFILAMMMIVGMIPISASAVSTGKIGITFKAGTLDDKAVLTLGEMKLLDQNTMNKYGTDNNPAYDVATAQGYVAKLNGVFTEASAVDGADIEAGENDSFYMAVKVDASQLSTVVANGKGFRNISMFLDYDGDVFEVGGTAGTQFVLNPEAKGAVANSAALAYVSGLSDYYGNFNMTLDRQQSGDGSETVSYVNITTSENYYFPSSHSTWDFIIPVKVKDSAAVGTYTIGWRQGKFGSSGGSMDVVTSENGLKFESQATNRDTDFETEPLTVKVVNRSAPPAVTDPGEYTITDKKNAPYVLATYANTAGRQGPNDYIQMPTGTAAFSVGDKIAIFADAEGKKKLGETTISKDNILSGNTWGSVGEINDGLIPGGTFRLIDEE